MNYQLIKNYLPQFLVLIWLFFCVGVELHIFFGGMDFFLDFLILWPGIVIFGAYWLFQVILIAIYSLRNHHFKYSKIRTLIKITVIPILLVLCIVFTFPRGTTRLKLSESSLLKCVENLSSCRGNSRIGLFYVYGTPRREMECTFFMTDTMFLSEWGLVYVPSGEEECVENYQSLGYVGEKIYGNWWRYFRH
ncbi:MAG: hypothetical protein F6K23_19030 [Okeania sp. SIO2C9]|uniref:hypothetical protein n=1 Tax=Okeania sp. SIO2C9 TaxID=2607791 RepID=UPI0013C0F1A5|nr:hypothetical protein [Okeania sp. SIO2C9]NEQ74947.1 hypothetical protein [Okeania sp. SIO2C9]